MEKILLERKKILGSNYFLHQHPLGTLRVGCCCRKKERFRRIILEQSFLQNLLLLPIDCKGLYGMDIGFFYAFSLLQCYPYPKGPEGVTLLKEKPNASGISVLTQFHKLDSMPEWFCSFTDLLPFQYLRDPLGR